MRINSNLPGSALRQEGRPDAENTQAGLDRFASGESAGR
jgi:hypothetical protein